jgi:hypothetical protein
VATEVEGGVTEDEITTIGESHLGDGEEGKLVFVNDPVGAVEEFEATEEELGL